MTLAFGHISGVLYLCTIRNAKKIWPILFMKTTT